MSQLRLDETTLPPECVEQMQACLGTRRIVGEGEDGAHQAVVLGVKCRVSCEGEELGSPLVIFSARPLEESSWSLGDCFPQLPGALEDSGGGRLFRLRFLTLDKALWLFVWGRDVQVERLRDRIAATAWFKDWAVDREVGDVSAEGLRVLFDTLGFDPRELQSDPRASWKSDDGGSGFVARAREADTSRAGLFMWGDVTPAALQVTNLAASVSWLRDLETFLGGASLLFTKGRLEHEEGFPRLELQLPPRSQRFGDDSFSFENAAVYFSSAAYYTPKDTRVGVKGDFRFSADKRFHVDLEYPIEGDVIRATGKYIGGAEHLLGDSASMGFPGPAPSFRADDEIELGLEFSKSARTLTKLHFSVELHQKHWPLIPAPVSLALEGVSFEVTIFDPLSSDQRAVVASIAAEAAFGDEGARLVCGGSYPSGQLFLQSKGSLKVGKLIEKLVGPSEGLDTFDVDDLRIEYNYRAKLFALEMDVKGRWKIVGRFEVEDIRFRIQGGEAYTGGLAARLQFGEGENEVEVHLSAVYDAGWQLEGSTQLGSAIPLGGLLESLLGLFEIDEADCPEALKGLEVSRLHVYGNTASKDFSFKATVEGFKLADREAELDLLIDVTHPLKGEARKRYSGILKVGDHEFDVVFATDAIEKNAVSNLVASYHTISGKDGPTLSLIAPDEWKEDVPDIELLAAFVALQRQPPDGSKRWLFGVKLKGGLDLGAIKLPNLPLVSRAAGVPSEVSLNLDFQAVGTKGGSFDAKQIAAIASLNATGALSLPAKGVEKVAIVALVTMNGKAVTLKLPVGKVGEGADATLGHREPDPAAPDAATSVDGMVGESAPDATAEDDTKWITVQKNIGPVHVDRLGLKYKSGRVWILFDAGLSAGGLTISLAGLGVDTPIDEFDPEFHLSGIGVDYKSPTLELGGAFLKREMKDPAPLPDGAATYTAYAGQAVLRTQQLALSAIGAYAKYHGEPSLFVYAVLDKPIGGPPFCFVTGLALGFGYNRRARIPKLTQVHTYPLITRAIAGPRPLPEDTGGAPGPGPGSLQTAQQGLMAQLQALDVWIPPDVGHVFLALGVKFTTFKLVDSFALLIARFGGRVRFDLLGFSHLQIPSKEAGGVGTPLAEVFMDWKAFFYPEEGELGLKAELLPGSFVYSRDCHLTGGFAYYAWFKGPHANDFVYTAGGYHPDFEKPPHYPAVSRLGFHWYLEKANLHLRGHLYYAVCGHALMAGGGLDANISGGFDIGIAGVHYQADLHIAADFLITWEPYHYDARVSLSLALGLSAHLLFFSWHGSLNVGADMHLWGPEFAGEAHVYLHVWKIRHTLDVKFGGGSPHLVPITWERFQQSFLPRAGEKTDPDGVCGVSVKRGLIRAIEEVDGERWIVNPKEFSLVTNSLIPSQHGNLGHESLVDEEGKIPYLQARHAWGSPQKDEPPREFCNEKVKPQSELGVASMGVGRELDTTHSVHLTRELGAPGKPGRPAESYFRCKPILKPVPSSLWGLPSFEDEKDKRYLKKPKVDGERLVPRALVGFEVLPAAPAKRSELHPVDRNELRYETELRGERYAWNTFESRELEPRPSGQLKERSEAETQVWDSIEAGLSRCPRRDRILAELGLKSEEVNVRRAPRERALDLPLIERERQGKGAGHG